MRWMIASVLLLAALAFGQTWVVEQVDSTAASGSPVELVKAADGRLWAGYQTKSGAARVACLSDSGWSFTDVCSAARLPSTFRRTFLAASGHGELCLACYDSAAGNNRLYRMVGDSWRSEINPYNDSYPCNSVAYDTSGRLYTDFSSSAGGASFAMGHEIDSGWIYTFVVGLPAYWYYTLFDVGLLAAANDGSPWFFGFSGWDDSPYKGEFGTALMHFAGDTWEAVWDDWGWPGWTPVPLALVAHGEAVGSLTYHDGSILYDSEVVMGWGSFPVSAGLAYAADDIPLVACVPTEEATNPYFAYRTSSWHTCVIPAPAARGSVDIGTDPAGQVVIVCSTRDSGLWCARGTAVVGVEESPKLQSPRREYRPTVLSGASVRSLEACVVFDAMGRRVRSPKPGVYFVKEAQAQAQAQAQAVRKVVIQR